jgi:hypothetical protein
VEYRVDGIPKRVDVDRDADGMLEETLVDTTSKGVPQMRFVPQYALPFVVPFQPNPDIRHPFGTSRGPLLRRAW